MKKGTHGIDEKSFEELDYAGQARTLNAQIIGIQKGLNAHIWRGAIENSCLKLLKV
jgi:hypothetical protein